MARHSPARSGRTTDSAGAGTVPPSQGTPGSAVHVYLLGGFRVEAAGRVLGGDDWRSQKAAALVKLLALAPGQRLGREELIDRLWPDLDPAAGTNNFHQALHTARRLLDPAGAGLLTLRHGVL